MSELRIRVSLGEDGRSPSWELLVDGLKICDLTYIELVEHAIQATSSLRWIKESLPTNNRV